jgi:hypothetical protein
MLALPAVVLWAVAAATGGITSDENAARAHHAGVVVASIATVLTGLALMLFAGMAVSFVRGRTVKAGRPAAHAIWRRGWYCRRCAVVFFAAGEEPAGVERGQVLDPGGFRVLVWTAGGYGRRARG